MENKETIITLKVDDTGAIKSIEGVKDNIKDAKKETQGLNKASKDTTKSTGGMARGFRAVGTAIKAAGIGLLIGIVARLTNVLRQNQSALDAVSVAFETVDLVLGSFVEIVTDAFNQIEETNGAFTSMGKVILGLINIAIAPLRLAFLGIESTVLNAQLAWEKSFLGKGDEDRIEELTGKINDNKEAVKDLAKDVLQAGEDIFDNFGNAVGGVVDLVGKTVEGVKEINIEAAKAEARRITEFRKNVKIQEALLEGINSEYRTQIELEKQLRDDTNRNVSDRIKSARRVIELIEEQGDKQREQAQRNIQLLQQEIANGDSTIETQTALIRAKNQLIEIDKNIATQQSNTLKTINRLENEQIKNIETLRNIKKSDTELSIQEAEEERDALRKLAQENITDELQLKQTLLDIEQKFQDDKNTIIEESLSKLTEFEESFRNQARIRQAQNEAEEFEIKREIERERFEQELAEIEGQEERKAELLAQFDKETFNRRKELKDEELENEKILRQQELTLASQTLGAIGNLFGEANKLAQGFQVASALMNTYNGITAALGAPTLTQRILGVAFASATGFGAVQDILSTNTQGETSSGNKPSTPSQSISGGARFDLTEPTVPDEVDDTPTQVYVTSDEISSQQSLDRNRQRNSRFI